MSTFKKHFPHFGLNNNNHHIQHQQQENNSQHFPNSSSLQQQPSHLHPGSRQTYRSIENNSNHVVSNNKNNKSSQSKSLPGRGSSLNNTNFSSKDSKKDKTDINNSQLTMASALDVASFKGDVLNCLDLCSSYITALNTVCSTGAVLAQTLTQLFSREVISNSPFNTLSGHSQNKSTCSLGRKGILGFKQKDLHLQSNSGRDLLSGNDLDSIYYDMTEQFLRSWEVLSVSTAGASATIKTETLMSLQEVINQLESDENDPPSSKSDDNDGNLDLGKSIEAAKSCLLSYIELQAQFSRSSWKSLNHLSKALKSDESMADPVKKIKRHFSESKNKKTSRTDANQHLDNTSSLKDSKSDQVHKEIVSGKQSKSGNDHHQGASFSSLDESITKSCSKGKKSHKNHSKTMTTSSSSQAIKHISGLKEAMELLSLFDEEDNVPQNKGENSEKKGSDQQNRQRKQVLSTLRTNKNTGVRKEPQSDNSSTLTQMKSNSTSTWPVKNPASAIGPQQQTTFFTPIGSGFSHTLGFTPDSWSPWSSSSPWLSNNSAPLTENKSFCYSKEVKSPPWKTSPSLADGSPSSSSSSSGSCSNNSLVGTKIERMQKKRPSFDPFAPVLEVNKLFESNNNNVMDSQRRKLASRTLPVNCSSGINNFPGNQSNSDFGLGGFGSLNYLPSHLSNTDQSNNKRLSYSSDGVNSFTPRILNQQPPPGMIGSQRKKSEDINLLMSQRMMPPMDQQSIPSNLSFIDSNPTAVPISSTHLQQQPSHASSLHQDPSRIAKTSTWPMKHNLSLLPSSGSTNFNENNWNTDAGLPSASSGYSSQRGVLDRQELSFAESILGPLNPSSTTPSNYQSSSSLWTPNSTSLTVVGPDDSSLSSSRVSPSQSFSLFSGRETNNNSRGLLDKNF
jgi:hypothetical protein